MIKLGVLGSTGGTDLQAIFDAIDSGELNARVSVVLSNQKSSYILKRAKNNNVPALFVPHKGKTREKFDTEMMGILKSWGVDLVLLIGFMRILSADFCLKWKGRLLNVHPSLLPKYKGLNTHQRVIDNKEKYSGCTVHYVNSKLDSGKIILQKKVKILKNDTFKRLSKKILKHEHILYPKALNKVLSNL